MDVAPAIPSKARQALAVSMALLLLISLAYLGVTLALPSADPMLATAPSPVPLQPTVSPPETSVETFMGGETNLVALGVETFTGAGGCSACHTVEGVSAGLVGPDLTHIGTDAATRKPGVSAEAYIRESIREPDAFVAEGVARAIPGLMTSALTANLSDDQVAALVEFLLAQK